MLWQVTEFLCFFRLNSTPLHMCTMLSFPTYYLMDGWVTSTSCSWEWVQKYLSHVSAFHCFGGTAEPQDNYI